MTAASACLSTGHDRRPVDGLTPVYASLAAQCPTLGLEVGGAPAGPGWISWAQVSSDPVLVDALLDAETALLWAERGARPRRYVVASRILHRLLWSTCLLISGPWYLERRVPRLRSVDVWIDPVGDRVRIAPQDVTWVPDDRRTGRPGAGVLLSEAQLGAELLAAVADWVRPLLDMFEPRARRAPATLWGMAGDDLVSGLWHLGRALGRESDATRRAVRLLPGPVPPFPAGAGFRELTAPDGRTMLTRTRVGCCLSYALPGGTACETCPRVGDTERLRRRFGATLC